jgi:hypothetical protein
VVALRELRVQQQTDIWASANVNAAQVARICAHGMEMALGVDEFQLKVL